MTGTTDVAGPWAVTHLQMRIELDTEQVVVSTVSTVERVPGTDAGPLVLDGRGLTTRSVHVDGVVADHLVTIDDRTLTVPLDGQRHEVATEVAVVPAVASGLGFTARPGLLSTTCEPEGFRRITWSIDRPHNRATYDVTLVGDPAHFPVMLANGHCVERGELPDGRHFARFDDPITKPSYLFAAVAGDLSLVSRPYVTSSGRTVTLSVAAPPALIGGADFALDRLAEAMRFDEANGGLEHDLDVLTFVAIPGYPDATEYHGLMFFEAAILVVDTRGFVDDDLLLIAANVAHEYGHHVRGNRITVRTWGNLALKEGLTVLMGQNDVRAHQFGPMSRVLDVLDLRRQQFPEETTIGAPVVRGEVPDPSALYNRTTYLKGAEVFGMLRTVLGPERWAAAFADYVRRFDLGAAGVDDFVAIACEQAPELADDLRAIARWFTLVGRPSLRITSDTIDADGSVRVVVERVDSLTDDPPVAVPVTIAVRDGNGTVRTEVAGTDADEHVAVLRDRRLEVVARATRPVSGDVLVSTLRRYSAPVDVAVESSSEQLAALVLRDDDPYVRWWSAQELMIRSIDAHRSGDTTGASTMRALLAATLGETMRTEADPALLAQLLAVPDEFMLGDRGERIDVDGVAGGLAVLRAELGVALHDALVEVLHRFPDRPQSTEATDIARRWLVEPVLALLLASGSADGQAIAMAEANGDQHTRAMRAFAQLLHVDSTPADELVAATYERWSSSPRLVDRWIRAQSGARRSDTIERVAGLVGGTLYDRSDRARVTAVWFPFATRNRTVFHHPSGAGYRLFVDELGVLMPQNPGLAVRFVSDLLQFKRFDDHRSALLRAELERMATLPGMPDFAVGILRSLLDAP